MPAKRGLPTWQPATPAKGEQLLTVPVPGREGQTARMRRFSARSYLAIRRGLLKDDDVLDLTLAAVVEFPGDPLDLPVEDLLELTNNWITAKLDEALPLPTA